MTCSNHFSEVNGSLHLFLKSLSQLTLLMFDFSGGGIFEPVSTFAGRTTAVAGVADSDVDVTIRFQRRRRQRRIWRRLVDPRDVVG